MIRISRVLAALFFLAVVFVAMIPLGRTLGDDVARTFAAINAVIVAGVVWFSRSGSRAWGHGFLFSGLLMLARPFMRQASDVGAALQSGFQWSPVILMDMGIGLVFLAIGLYFSLSDRKEILFIGNKLVIRRAQDFR